jgi:hypothetical protein
MGIKKYYESTKEQDKDGASPLVSLEEVIGLINKLLAKGLNGKRYNFMINGEELKELLTSQKDGEGN